MAQTGTKGSFRTLISESGVYGVLVVSGLVVVLADKADASWDILVKVLGTVLVFWAAHLYSGVVAHLGDEHAEGTPLATRFRNAASHSVDHSWGLLVAAGVPTVVLLLGVLGVVSDQNAIWGVLWLDVVLLGVLGYAGLATWTPSRWARLAGALGVAALGVVLILLKSLIH